MITISSSIITALLSTFLIVGTPPVAEFAENIPQKAAIAQNISMQTFKVNEDKVSELKEFDTESVS